MRASCSLIRFRMAGNRLSMCMIQRLPVGEWRMMIGVPTNSSGTPMGTGSRKVIRPLTMDSEPMDK